MYCFYDEQTIKTMVDDEIDKILEGQLCSICGYPFKDREEKNNAVCSGKNLKAAHGYCWYWLQIAMED